MDPRLKKVGTFIRDAWLMVGLAFVLLFLLEGAYRLQGAVRQRLGMSFIQRPEPIADRSDAHPYADSAWFVGWDIRRDSALRGGWRHHPYLGWTIAPFTTAGLTVDSNGLRVVPDGRIGSGRDTVYFLGGSAAWGYTARDSFTIAAGIARGLRRRGLDDVEVVFLAQAGYNFVQGIAALQQRLRFGSRPAAVVFFDGVNEFGPYVEGEPLWGVYGQRQVAERIALGKRSGIQEILGLGRHLAIVNRLRMAVAPAGGPRDDIDDQTVCNSVATWYLAGARTVRSLAEEFGFRPLLVWQPSLGTTNKRLTVYEEYRMEWEDYVGISASPLMKRCTPAVDSVMALLEDAPYVSLSTLFDHDTTDVFLDGFGHVTERVNAVIGDSLAALIAPRISPRYPPATGRGVPR